MKFILLSILMSLFYFDAFAETPANLVKLYCNGESIEDCESRVNKAMENIGCDRVHKGAQCEYFERIDGPDKIGCTYATFRCSEPRADLIGWSPFSVYCSDSIQDRKNIKRQDRKLNLRWSFGAFRGDVRHICVQKEFY